MRFLPAFLAACLFCLPAFAAQAASVKPYALSDADKQELKLIQDYLSGIHTISAEFTQASPGGDISFGKFYLQRPGKLRMEYSPPVPVLMVTSGDNIVYYDKELDQVTRISLESTLVGFLARNRVEFDDTVIITHFEHENGSVSLSLVQTKRPKDGTLTLEFSDHPLLIRNMIVTDTGGQTTTVSLNNARFDIMLDKNLFVFKDPHLGSRAGTQK